MKNVVVFPVGSARFAVELRWVREVAMVGHVTPVPTAPAAILGAFNFHGAIVPLLSVAALVDKTEGRLHASGDAVLLVDVDGTRAGFAVRQIDEVTSLAENDAGQLVDPQGRQVFLCDPAAMLATAKQLVEAAAGRL